MKFRFGILLITLFSILVSAGISSAQNADVDSYRKINQITDAAAKIEALKKFRSDFSASRYFSSSLQMTFSSFVQLGKADSALSYAEKFLNTILENSREMAYNNIASLLSDNKLALSDAQKYIAKAVASARTNKSKSLANFLDTQAGVYFNLGKIDSALAIQKEAMTGNEKNAEFLTNLAVYEEASSKRVDALKTISKSILAERSDKAVELFNQWVEKEKQDPASQEQLKESVSKEIVDEYLKNDNSAKALSNAASYFAILKTNLKSAEKYAGEASKGINEKTSVEDFLFIKTNLALVYNAKGDLKNTLAELLKAEELASAWDTEFWLLLGNTYEKLNQKEKALEAYLNVKIIMGNAKIDAAIKSIAQKLGLSDEAVAKKLDDAKKEMKDFEPGVYDKKSFGKKVVVAELFTGAECPPCVAADRAFDKLSEFYPRDAVVILEYHLHIPGPDPITNPDTHLKYLSYGGNFGTPTVFFDGGNQLVGGGPDFITKNRFNVYNYLIKKSSKQNIEISFNGTASIKNDVVDVALSVEQSSSKKELANCLVQIALVEKSIDYKGSNGIDKHIFAVRDLVNGADGIPVKLIKGKQAISEKIDVAQVESAIKKYLDDPSKEPSWRMRSGFQGWKARPDKIDRNNLAVVVYIQSKGSKQILQARYFDLK